MTTSMMDNKKLMDHGPCMVYEWMSILVGIRKGIMLEKFFFSLRMDQIMSRILDRLVPNVNFRSGVKKS